MSIFRVPVDESYTAILGRAVYNFAYYEWIVIWTLEKLKPGYLVNYSTHGYTSGNVASEWNRLLKTHPLPLPAMQTRLETCAATFDMLFRERNRLLHAHPYTAEEGIQRLNYHGRLPGTKGPFQDVELVAKQFDDAAC